MKKGILVILTLALNLMGVTKVSWSQTYKSIDVKGIWLNQDKDAKIEIFENGGKYYGKIVWLKTPIDPETNKPKVDKHNPNPALRNRSTLGLEILKDFSFDGKDEWKDGTIYDPKSGKTYSCYIRMENRNKLKIRGFIGVSMLGRTTYWTRSSL
ncbi:MAG: hypothetical protein PWR20_2352 [Bacteroidales bacterium]|nr:hypothetical protein [Bacteroidales bacterium]MDN5330697.1 hypothetical protein [Bacteroidales bacterium]